MVKKTQGKLNGWVSYTYSRTQLRQNDPMIVTPVNNGDWYAADFDKPHDLKFVGNYKFTHRFSFSLNCDYSTGRPITLPVSKYHYGAVSLSIIPTVINTASRTFSGWTPRSTSSRATT